MIKHFRLTLGSLCMILLASSASEGQSLFSKKITTSLRDRELVSILDADHASILCAGRVTSVEYPYTSFGFTLAKIDTSGNILWKKKYDPDHPKWKIYPKTILQQDYGYLIGGWLDHGKGDATLLKIDQNGNILDFNRLHPVAEHFPTMIPNHMLMQEDGALVMTGRAGLGHEHSNLLWIKTDDNFSIYEVKIMVSVKDLDGIRVFPLNNGKTLIAFNNGSLDDEYNTVFPGMMKLDAHGEVLNVKNYKIPIQAALNDCIRLEDGSFVMVGSGYEYSYILKIDSDLNLVWCKTYPIVNKIENTFSHVTPAPDGGFLISGVIYHGFPIPQDYFIMKTDEEGMADSYLLGDGSDEQTELGVTTLSTSTYLAAGVAGNDTTGFFNIFNLASDLSAHCSFSSYAVTSTSASVVTDQNNLLYADDFVNQYYLEDASFTISKKSKALNYCSLLKQGEAPGIVEPSMLIAPNPASGTTALRLSNEFADGITRIQIYNSLGMIMHSGFIQNESFTQLDVANFPRGTYMVKVISERGHMTTELLEVF